MNRLNLEETLIVACYVKQNYSQSAVIVAWVDSTDDFGAHFTESAFQKQELVFERYMIIEGNRCELENLLNNYPRDKADCNPYMQLFVNGQYVDENT